MPNPYEQIENLHGLSSSSNGQDSEWLFLLCRLGAALDSTPTSGNPYSDLLARLEQVGADGFALRRLRAMLSTPKNNWDRRPA